jgi:hypothetical protein
MGARILAPSASCLRHPAAEVLRNPPHVHQHCPDERRQPEVSRRLLRHVGCHDREELRPFPRSECLRSSPIVERRRGRDTRPDTSGGRSGLSNGAGQADPKTVNLLARVDGRAGKSLTE